VLGPQLWGWDPRDPHSKGCWDPSYGAGTPETLIVRGAGTPAVGLGPELWGWDPQDPHSRGC